jgi:WD40 repeat protein
VGRPLDLHRTVHRVAFTADGRSLVTQDHELIRVWTLPQDGLPMRGAELDSHHAFAMLSPDGTLAIPTGTTIDRGLKSMRAYRVATGEAAGPSFRPGGMITDAAFSPDGRSVATCTARESLDPPSKEGQEVHVWDWSSGKERWRALVPSGARSLAYRPDSQRLAVLCAYGELTVFDAGAGREVLRWRAKEGGERSDHWINNGKVGYSPDGQGLLVWGMGNDVRVFAADSGKLRYAPLVQRDKCHDLEFSPDGRLMALASYDHSVRVRDFATGSVVAQLPAHPDMVYSARFSPNGRLLVTACRDRTVRVWDWRAGKLACPQFEHAKDATAAVFTPDGHWVLSVSVDGTARAWDWRSGKPVTPSLLLRGRPLSVAVTPDGKHAVVGGFRTELALLDLGELARGDDDPDALCLWAELLAGQRLHEKGGTVNLSAAEWLDRWRNFKKQPEGGRISN